MSDDSIYTPEVRAAFPASGVKVHQPDRRTMLAVEDALNVIEFAAYALRDDQPNLANIRQDILQSVRAIQQRLGLEGAEDPIS